MAQPTLRGGCLQTPLSNSSTQLKMYLKLGKAKRLSYGLVYEENREYGCANAQRDGLTWG